MIIALYCVIFGLMAVIFVLLRLGYVERKDLYNRIMSGSIREYQSIGKTPEGMKSGHKRVLERWRMKDDDKI